jgi:hypothetical protein
MTQWEQPLRQTAGPVLACRNMPVPANHTAAVTFLGHRASTGPVLASQHGKLSVPSWQHHGIFINFGCSFSLDKLGKIGHFLYFNLHLLYFHYNFLRKHKEVSAHTFFSLKLNQIKKCTNIHSC